MRYTFVNSKYRGDHSDHHQPSGTNKNDTCRHTTGGEQHDTVGTAHTQMHTHTNRALCRWEAAGSNFNLCGAAYDTYNDIAHLRCLCFLYSQPRRHSVKRGFPLHLNLRCWLVRVLFFKQEATQPSAQPNLLLLDPFWIFFLRCFPFVLSYNVAYMNMSLYECAFVCVLKYAPLVQQHWPAKSSLPSPMINMQAYGGAAGTRGRSRLEIFLWFN